MATTTLTAGPLLLALSLASAPAHAPANAIVADPPARAHHALAWDEARGVVVLTGGSTPHDAGRRFEFFNDLWTFDGTAWRALPPAGNRRSGQMLAWDSRRRRLMSLGGLSGDRPLDDLRRLDDDGWVQVGESFERPVLEGGLVYDVERDRLVLFGGSGGGRQSLGETWEWSGGQWTRMPGDGPEPRQGFAMAHDARRGRTVLFGGAGDPPNARFGDTWEYDGRSWTRMATTGPSARVAAGSAWDSRRGLFVVFGGLGAEGFLGDTWGWDGVEWKKLSDRGPEPRAMGYMAYDRARDRIVLFGGRKGWPDGDLGDTWEWDGATWTRVGS
jgi:hypothetical protein